MDIYIRNIQEALETRRYTMLEFLEMAAVRRLEVRHRLDVAVMRQQYLDDALTQEEEVLLEHIRNAVELPAIHHAPLNAANPIDEIDYYAGEIIEEDEPEVVPWIHDASAGMVFADQLAVEG
ncbi:GSCOCG00011332001-RA-CDS, partial [Cotesia congregata]